MEGKLVLEDGTIMEGEGFGSAGIAYGEMVFSTSMTGYQESITDPSYFGQILVFTYPLVGNYGINQDDFESNSAKTWGVVVKEHCKNPSHRKSVMSLHEFLRENHIPGVSRIDTRALTQKLRLHGTMKGAIVCESDVDLSSILEKVQTMDHPMTSNLVARVSCKDVIEHRGKGEKRVILIDCGAKRSITDGLAPYADVIQVPYDTSADEIWGFDPDGIVVSNGPGDPAHPALYPTVKVIEELSRDLPMLGICMGHQLIARSFGAKTYKMKFGHRGANQPVKDLETGKIFITTQNHGYGISVEDDLDICTDQINAIDGTIESITHRELSIISVQYHPEANPGPLDTAGLFWRFFEMINCKMEKRCPSAKI